MVSLLFKPKARWVLDSRGNPTVEVEVGGFTGIAPAGASKGKHEAPELRDGGKPFLGMGVSKAVAAFNRTLFPLDAFESQQAFDSFLEQRLVLFGANTTTAASVAFARWKASQQKTTLAQYFTHFVRQAGWQKAIQSMPANVSNLINGGAHAGNNLSIQEFLLIPVVSSFAEGTQITSEVYHQLKKKLLKKYGRSATNVGDEGGFAPNLKNNRAPLELIWSAVEESGYEKKVKLGLDLAATQFYNQKNKNYKIAGKTMGAEKLLDYYARLAKDFPIAYFEDPFYEEDFKSFALMKMSLPQSLIVGDDLLTTQAPRVEKAIKSDSCNCLLLKVNQAGTISRALQAFVAARKAGWSVCVSHRSGDSEDAFIADLAVGIGAELIKLGAPARAERTAKYNQLLRIEEKSREQ